jgi:DNA processing protein
MESSTLSQQQAQDVRAWLALLYAPGIGSVHFQQILQHFPSPRAFFESYSATLPDSLSLPAASHRYLASPDWQRADKELQWAEAQQCQIITFHDHRYPALLKEIPDPPPLLFVHGNTHILQRPQLAVVGSRNPSAGGRQTASEFARGLANAGLVITSGLALGIDAASHQGALQAKASTLAVTGTGPDRIYPARHRELAEHILEQGAIVTEFPLQTPPLAANFPRRNRIISGLSLGTLVEAALRSGSLITARLAAEQGREVFAIPGSIHNPLARGCHNLIRQGAKLTESLHDILEELAPLAAISLQQQVSAGDGENNRDITSWQSDSPLCQYLDYRPVSVDELIERSGLTPETVSAMLLTLELEGRVTSTGGLYSRTDQSRYP